MVSIHYLNYLKLNDFTDIITDKRLDKKQIFNEKDYNFNLTKV